MTHVILTIFCIFLYLYDVESINPPSAVLDLSDKFLDVKDEGMWFVEVSLFLIKMIRDDYFISVLCSLVCTLQTIASGLGSSWPFLI